MERGCGGRGTGALGDKSQAETHLKEVEIHSESTTLEIVLFKMAKLVFCEFHLKF